MTTISVGATVKITTEIRNDSGDLVDPSGLTLTIMLPDLTQEVTELADLTKDGVGLYRFDYPTEIPGPHIARWVSVGPSTTDEQPFHVEAMWTEAGIVPLAAARSWLKKKKIETDDDKLQEMILAATDMIQDRMGAVVPVQAADFIDLSGMARFVTDKRPVIEIISMTMANGTVIPQADPMAGVYGWHLDNPEGVVKLTRRVSGMVQVVYRVGRVPVPYRFRVATKELVAHLWRTTQMNTDGGRPPAQGEIQVADRSSWALPYNVRQLLGLDKLSRDIPSIG